MIFPGHIVYARGILSHLRCIKTQIQPCGIDPTLKNILTMKSAGRIDFDNSGRKTSTSALLRFDTITRTSEEEEPSVHLQPGTYLVEFNEAVCMPLNIMGQPFVRSWLFRSGAHIHAGVMDSGYEGVIGAMLTVANEKGLRVCKDARLVQMVFHEMSEATEGYNGQYQGRGRM